MPVNPTYNSKSSAASFSNVEKNGQGGIEQGFLIGILGLTYAAEPDTNFTYNTKSSAVSPTNISKN